MCHKGGRGGSVSVLEGWGWHRGRGGGSVSVLHGWGRK